MRTLLEETAELLSRAKYMEEKHPNTSITPDYWTRLKSVCAPLPPKSRSKDKNKNGPA